MKEKSITLNYGDKIWGNAPTVNRPGYRLEGWYTQENGQGEKLTESTTVTEDADYYAHWIRTIITYGISYDMNGFKGTNTNTISSYEAGNSFTPAPLDNYYDDDDYNNYQIFIGWNPSSIVSGQSGDVEFTATWKKMYLKATFHDTYDGRYNTPIPFLNGSPMRELDGVFGTPSDHDGKTCIGWKWKYTTESDNTLRDFSFTSEEQLNEDIEMYAQWKELPEYTVTFDAGGGRFPSVRISNDVITMTYKENSPISAPVTPEYDDEHTFNCWTTDSNNDYSQGELLQSSVTKCTSDITYYAHYDTKEIKWIKASFTNVPDDNMKDGYYTMGLHAGKLGNIGGILDVPDPGDPEYGKTSIREWLYKTDSMSEPQVWDIYNSEVYEDVTFIAVLNTCKISYILNGYPLSYNLAKTYGPIEVPYGYVITEQSSGIFPKTEPIDNNAPPGKGIFHIGWDVIYTDQFGEKHTYELKRYLYPSNRTFTVTTDITLNLVRGNGYRPFKS